MKEYAPLHVHDTYGSIGDSILRISDYINKAKELGINNLALTNHGSMSTYFEFYLECKKNNINPIIGCEIYLCDDRQVRNKVKNKYFHLVLLAKDYDGLINLISIHNDAHENMIGGKPRTDLNILSKYSNGLICLSGCLAGPISKNFLNNDKDKLICYVEKLKEIFKSDLYFEIQPGKFSEQIKCNDMLVRLAKKLHIGTVLTNDIHYLNKDDYLAHDYHIKSIRKKSYCAPMIYPDKCYYFMSPKELYFAIKRTRIVTDTIVEKSIKNTMNIAKKCNISLDVKNMNIAYKDVIDGDNFLENICNQKLKKKNLDEKHKTRLSYELDIVKKLNFSNYFLIVKDIIDFCDKNDIPRGPGRGSCCSSMISWLLGISTLDPVEYDLMFERFLSLDTKEYPDIDLDIGERREEVYSYIANTYGKNNCRLVSKYNTRKARNAIKSSCSILGYGFELANEISELIPEYIYNELDSKNTTVTIQDAYANIKTLQIYLDKYPNLKRISQLIEGYPTSISTHPAGIVISPKNISNLYPIINKSSDVEISSMSYKFINNLSSMKFDILALNYLSILDNTMKDLKIDDSQINTDYESNKKVWEEIGSKNTTGLFQISSNIYKNAMPLLKPKNIKELANCLALLRRPSILSKTDKEYISILRKETKPEKLHSVYWEATSNTYGVLIYQEQVLKICNNIGFSSTDSYKIMKLISKKNTGQLNWYKDKFFELCANKNISEEVSNKMWSKLVNSGEYIFNMAHALSYAFLCYKSAYLKVNYPIHFLANLLTKEYCGQHKEKTINDLISECNRLNIKILPLKINKSKWEFTVENGSIRVGFCAVKGIGKSMYESINTNRKIDLESFILNQNKIPKKILMILIACKAFNGTKKENLEKYNLIRNEQLDGTIKIGTNKSFNMFANERHVNKMIYGSDFMFKE